jgi:iron-sulfur cluster repair protein YtfE (RIC family)
MEKTIKEIMTKEHAKILDLLASFEKDKLKYSLNLFKWQLEKHFFVEEKVVFRVYLSSSDADLENLTKLLKDHKDILWSLKKIEETFSQNNFLELYELKKNLVLHTSFENNVFYPRLDTELSQDQKDIIMERSEEIFD